MKSDLAALRHILQSIERIEAYTTAGKDEFLTQTIVQDAVLRNLEIMGEATKRLSPALRANHPEVPWNEMAALRDVLAHGYMSVDLEIVWEVIENRLGDLSRTVSTIKRDVVEKER